MTDFSPRNVWIVARREYRARVRTRSFLLSTFATPILMSVFMLLPAFIAGSTASSLTHDNAQPVRIAIACDNRTLATFAGTELTGAGRGRYTVTIVSPALETERDRLARDASAGKIDGYVWLDGPGGASRRVSFTTNRMGDFILQNRLANALSYAFAADRMMNHGPSADDVAATLQRVDLTAVRPASAFSVYNAVRGAAVVFILL